MHGDLKISEIREKYKDQWVVVEVTKVDKHNNPLRGCVLFHGLDDKEVYGQGPKYRQTHPNADLFYFYAGNVIPEGIGVMLVQVESNNRLF